MKRLSYGIAGIAVLIIAGLLIYQSLNASLVYFILPNEYAQQPGEYQGRRLRLGGIVETDSVRFDDESLQLTFMVTDSLQRYPVHHRGSPPELFKENTGVVVEGSFNDGVFISDNLLVKHSEVYEPPPPGESVDVEALKDSLQ